MDLYPAIDLYEGKVVRLERGDFTRGKVYSDRPEEMARQWCGEGARWLHIVDLEGAKTGSIRNREAVLKIRRAVDCQIEFGGGIRKLDTLKALLADGIDRVVIGTKALETEFIQGALEAHGAQVAIGLDVRDGRVQMQGWLKEGGKTMIQALEWLNHFPVETVIYTDIQKDGMLSGPNFNGLAAVLEKTQAGVILSGGISELEDIKQAQDIREANFKGVIVGKAIYEGRFSVHDAITLMRKARG